MPGTVLALIPARNEARAIGRVVAGCRAQGLGRIWVLDDASCDATAEEARAAGASEVIRFPRRTGKTGVLRHALRRLAAEPEATAPEWIAFLDGDGQHDPARLPDFLDRRAEADLLIGNRWADARQMPPIRRATNRAMSALLNTLTGAAVPDTQCGYRLARRDLLAGWLPRGRHYEFETELTLHALRRGARLAHIPLPAIYAGERSAIFWPRDTARFAWCVLRGCALGAPPPAPRRRE